MVEIIAVGLLLLAGLVVYVFASGPKLPPEAEAIIESVVGGAVPEVVRGEAGYAVSGGRKIWYERLPPEAPAKGTVMLLISMGASGLDWPAAFVLAFSAAGYQVIRYD